MSMSSHSSCAGVYRPTVLPCVPVCPVRFFPLFSFLVSHVRSLKGVVKTDPWGTGCMPGHLTESHRHLHSDLKRLRWCHSTTRVGVWTVGLSRRVT